MVPIKDCYLPLLPSLLRSGRDQCSGVFNCPKLESQIGEYSQLSACYGERKARRLGHEFCALRSGYSADPRLYFSTPQTYSELTASRFNQAQEIAISGENGRLSLTSAPCALRKQRLDKVGDSETVSLCIVFWNPNKAATLKKQHKWAILLSVCLTNVAEVIAHTPSRHHALALRSCSNFRTLWRKSKPQDHTVEKYPWSDVPKPPIRITDNETTIPKI